MKTMRGAAPHRGTCAPGSPTSDSRTVPLRRWGLRVPVSPHPCLHRPSRLMELDGEGEGLDPLPEEVEQWEAAIVVAQLE